MFAAALTLSGAEPKISDTPIDLVQQSRFRPVMMHGRPSAAFGWYLFDGPRYRYIRGETRYLSGEKCFRLTFENDAMTLTWSDPLEIAYTHPKYRKNPIYLATRVSWPPPPAPKYHTTGRVKFSRGEMTVAGKKIAPKDDWQTIDITGRVPFDRIGFTAVPGASYTFGEMKCLPVYPEIGGEISLPDGGKLTRFLLPENADYLTRWGVSLWRGWLWKLTGVALPIETVKEVKPTPGAFAAMKGETAPGGWLLTVDKGGITLICGDPREMGSALFDYLRLGLKCAFYTHDCKVLPKDGSVKQLPAIRREAKPKFRYFHCSDTRVIYSGGNYEGSRTSANDCDYYHLANPQDDHVLNVIMPKELYFEKHPEFFMQDRFGRRVAGENPLQINPCFSNREGMETMARNLVDYARGQSLATSLVFSPGDAFTLCLCPECVKFNGGTASNTDSQFEFANIFMPMLAKVRPDMTFLRSAYASHHALPTHVKLEVPNVDIGYCLGHDVLPCTLHIDCEPNRRGLEELKGFMKLAGGPERLSVTTYRDVRPLHHLRQMEFLNRYAKGTLHVYIWKGYSSATGFTTARWNLGEDPGKLLEEFDSVYYGKGGKYVHEINLLVDEYARNYRHTPEELAIEGIHHLCIWGGDLRSRTLLDRPTLDRIYALFAKALEAEKEDKRARRHIIDEKKFYLSEDLIRWNRNTCKTEAELAAFAGRIAELVRDAREARFPYTIYGITARELLMSVAGWDIPDTGRYWADEPAVEKFLADPMSLFLKAPDRIPGGWYFPPSALEYATKVSLCTYECPPRAVVSLQRPSFGSRSSATAVLPLTVKPAAPLCLAIEGLDDDKPGKSPMKVEVNGHTLFEGPNAFKEHEWSRMCFMIPAEYLQLGDNAIRISCLTPETPSRSARFPDDPGKAKTDKQWGWINISEVIVSDPNGDFALLAENRRNTLWCQSNVGLKKDGRGKITAFDGKVVFTAGTEPLLRLAASRGKNPKIPVNTGGATVRMTVEVSGTGKLQLRLPTYRPYLFDPETKTQRIERSGFAGGLKYCRTHKSPEFELTAEPKTITCDFKLLKAAGLVYPEILLIGPGKMTVTKFRFEELPASGR